MSKTWRRWAWVSLLSLSVAVAVATHSPSRPLEASRVLALVAGSALPENVIALVHARGLAFHPSPDFRALLSRAGATPEILNALDVAVVKASKQSEDPLLEAQFGPHLATAAELIRDGKYSDAETELNAAWHSGCDKLDVGFVMGEAMRRQERWDMAVATYQEILRQEKSFPEAHTKLSYVLYRIGDAYGSLREAKAALSATPSNAEARKNGGLALETMRRFDAAAEQYREALRLKPDYQSVHFDLGILLYDKGDLDGAIAEYKKAMALSQHNSDASLNVDVRVNLALAYRRKNDLDSALRELREAKTLSPGDFRVRQDLGSVLMDQHRNADAVAEWRELEAMAPESVVCHICLGSALYNMAEYDEAMKEYKVATRLDPSDIMARRAVGRVYEAQQKYELALDEYREAKTMDESSVETRLCLARVLLQLKQPTLAAAELIEAIQAEPGNPQVHCQYGKVLEASGDPERAKNEYRESLLLDPDKPFAQLDLAALLEKQGDWPGALEHYHLAAQKVEAALQQGPGVQGVFVDAPGSYRAAQTRFAQHLSDLKAAGKASEAAELQAKVDGARASQGISGELDSAMEAGADAFREHKSDEAERNYQHAAKLAGQLQPHDGRLVMSLGFLGALYMERKDYANAQAAFERQLKAAEEVNGTGSAQVATTLQALTRVALESGDTSRAESFAHQQLTITEKNSGTDTFSYSMGLMTLGFVYLTEKKYGLAQPYLEKAVKIHEQVAGPQGMVLVSSKRMLCETYDGLKQPEEAAQCHDQLLKVMENVYGPNSTALAPILAAQAKDLRELGRSTEAADVEQRIKAVQKNPSASKHLPQGPG